jgi:hypothetical protein
MVKTQEYKDLQARSVPYEVRFFRYWFNNISKKFYKNGTYQFDYGGQLKEKQLWALFEKFQSKENEKLGYITKTVFINDMKKHKIKGSSDSYLKANNNHILTIGKTNQIWYKLEQERCKKFFQDEGIDFEEIEFIPSESESDTDTDDEDE